jgi:hypothetical protein
MQFGMDQVYYCPDPIKMPSQDDSSPPESCKTSTIVISHLEQLLDIL